MKASKPLVAFFLLPTLHALLSGHGVTGTITIYVSNKCPFPIWPATAPNSGQPVIADGGFSLQPGQTHRIWAPVTWTGRIWARTGCSFRSNWKPACQTGDCDGRLACNGTIGVPPATLIEFSFGPDKTKPSFYDVSLVDGYNLPVSVTTRLGSPNCTIGGCLENLNEVCPQELQVQSENGGVVACKSACLAFDLDRFCCRNEYGSPEKCKASMYSKIFKEACPSYVSYAFDSPPPIVTCASREYVITFCPSKWGLDDM
ncbi:Thaumatin family [Dillenia turbinata]|uniref:Thaumatin family n=1 Tax=Dillenia turbinata TaxID=194707 RepID=A0AAN8UI89_9MAGN